MTVAGGRAEHHVVGPDADVGWFVYGVSRPDLRVPEDLLGLDDQSVTLVAHGDLAAVVSRVALDRPPGRRQELLAYSRVLDALAARGPVAPVSFGSVLADETDIIETLLGPRHEQLSELLDELTGRVQLNLRVRYVEEAVLAEVLADDPRLLRLRDRLRDLPADAELADRIRLGQLVAQAVEERRAGDADALLSDLAPFLVAYVERAGTGLEHVLHIAMLVAAEDRARLEERLEEWAEWAQDRMRMQLVGPVAPYDFVGDE